MNFATLNKQRKFILIVSAIGIIAMFLPWIDVVIFSVNGMHDKGIIVFLCFVVAGIIAYLGDQTKNLERTSWFIALICGGLATLIMIWFYISASGDYGGSFFTYGFYIAALAAIGVIVAAYFFRAPGDDIKSGFDSLKNKIEQETKKDSNI
jgi:peptidoglycan/LPS O-acetylase OafA/YrhL